MDFRITKKTLAPGWAEITIVTRRGYNDSPDFELTGEPARLKIAKLILSMAAGFGTAFGDDRFEELCWKFARKHKLAP